MQIKIITLFLISFLFISCGVQSVSVLPESKRSNNPELNTIINSEIGEELVLKEIGHKYKAIKVTKGRKPKPGYIITEIKEGDIFYHNSNTSKYNLYRNENDNTFGLAIPKAGGNPIVYTNNGNGITFSFNKDIIEYTNTSKPDPEREYIKQELIYNGRVGTALKFIYREYTKDYIKPAFTQELQYDLAESRVIGFRGLRLEVINTTNTNIEYKVLSYFN
ncbi:hypothetical protein [Flavobacterium dankookense]|uniref:Lipoprotein n=1 Tax=Flavobacterium dankookense TaxID=706186 RepID=A0A4V3CRP7_9FLAO|nr:hypothetical protein [Flavobacterium dankookense]TDP57632.1 hypothetical protein BC748_2847 [Flavobacterium dankookense]